MVTKTIAPYGQWKSPLTVEAVTAGSRSLGSPRVDPVSGRAFFLESRANGTRGIVEILPDGSTKHVLPETSSAGTVVYEYGGLPYAVLPAGSSHPSLRILFSDAKDKSINLLDVDSGKVTPLIKSDTLRYAEFDPHPRVSDGGKETAWVLAVEEDHEKPAPADVRDYVVAINVDTAEVKRLCDTADFYMYPRFSPDATKIAWKEFDHPNMPFMQNEIRWADWSDDGAISNAEGVAAGVVTEPRWSPDGTLFWCQEKTNYRQLFRRKPGQSDASAVTIPGVEDYEFGDASCFVGVQGYVFLSATSIVAAPAKNGAYDIFHIDLAASTATKLDTPLNDMRFDNLARASSTSVIAIGAGYTSPQAVYRITLTPSGGSEVKLISSSTDTEYPPSLFSTPVPVTFPSRKGNPARNVHGFFWPPHNNHYAPPDDGSLPPLLITTHGGPVAHSGPGLKLMDQYYLTRGYAVFAVNYTGSSGHGAAYREALMGRWGVCDTDDAADAAEYLARAGKVDGRRVGIVGGSAGGYNVLMSLTHYPTTFAGGVCYCGVSDVSALAAETHKIESKYMDVLMGFGPGAPEEEKAARFRERSPITYAQNIEAPLLLIHGDKDTVVPIQQSYDVKAKIEGRGGDVDMIVLEGEGHMFARAESWQTFVLDAERWWQRTLLRKLD